MHEAAIAQAILRKACQSFEQHQLRSGHSSSSNGELVSRIVVSVGEFRNVDPESLEFAFSALKKEYRSIEACQLDLVRVEALAVCSLEEHRYHPVPEHFFACTECGGSIKKLLKGDELDIISIEIE